MMSHAKYENIKGKDQIKIKNNLKMQIIKMCSNLGQKTYMGFVCISICLL